MPPALTRTANPAPAQENDFPTCCWLSVQLLSPPSRQVSPESQCLHMQNVCDLQRKSQSCQSPFSLWEKKTNPSDSRTLKSDWFSYVFVWRYVAAYLPEPPSPLWLWHGINTGVAARSLLAKLSCSNKYWQSCLLLLADLKLIFAFRLTRWRKYSFFLISLPLIVEAETFCTVFFFFFWGCLVCLCE